jgi:hypothetical protein
MVPVAITGNIFDEATTPFGNIFYEATRGAELRLQLKYIAFQLRNVTRVLR